MSRFGLRAAGFSSLVAALAFIACAEPQQQQPPQVQAQAPQSGGYIDRVCNTLCQKRLPCDPNFEGAVCLKNCRERGSPARAFWRDDYAKATLACVDAAGCDVMATGEATEKKCFTDTRPEPSETAKHFCEVSQEKERSCGSQAPDMPGCLRAWGMISDAALTDMIACQDRPCGKTIGCAKAVVGFPKPDGN